MGYTSFGGTVADIDRDVNTVTIALKWEAHSNQECNKTLTCGSVGKVGVSTVP